MDRTAKPAPLGRAPHRPGSSGYADRPWRERRRRSCHRSAGTLRRMCRTVDGRQLDEQRVGPRIAPPLSSLNGAVVPCVRSVNLSVILS